MGKPNIVSEEKRAAAQRHAGRVTTCDCRKRCLGNGGWSSHKKACKVFQGIRSKRITFERERIEQYLAAGMSRGEAEYAARRDWHFFLDSSEPVDFLA